MVNLMLCAQHQLSFLKFQSMHQIWCFLHCAPSESSSNTHLLVQTTGVFGFGFEIQTHRFEVGLELPIQLKLTLSSQSFCLHFPSAGIKNIGYHVPVCEGLLAVLIHTESYFLHKCKSAVFFLSMAQVLAFFPTLPVCFPSTSVLIQSPPYIQINREWLSLFPQESPNS